MNTQATVEIQIFVTSLSGQMPAVLIHYPIVAFKYNLSEKGEPVAGLATQVPVVNLCLEQA